MDVSILQALVAKVLKYEGEYNIQSYLEQTRDAVANMVGSPQEPTYQTHFAEGFKNLKASLMGMSEALSPGDWDRLDEIAGKDDFSNKLSDDIEKLINENAATPAVIRDSLVKIAADRSNELGQYKALLKNLNYFGFDPSENDLDEAQVGFKIPRSIFDNHFTDLINELNFIRKFVRMIAEAEGENPDDVDVGSISTTDPVFWLIVAFGVGKSIAKIADWCLDTWKKVEDIRNIRAQTAQLQAFEADEVERIFGPKIEQQIQAAIEAKVEELTRELDDQGRKNELQNGLRYILRQFLARVERGLTVDIKYLPHSEANDDAESSEEKEHRRSEIHEVASRLVFPRAVGEPVLKLEAANDDKASKP